MLVVTNCSFGTILLKKWGSNLVHNEIKLIKNDLERSVRHKKIFSKR